MVDMEDDSEESSEGSLGWCLEPLTYPVSTPRGAGSEDDDGSVRVTMDMMISGKRFHWSNHSTHDTISIGISLVIGQQTLQHHHEEFLSFTVDDAYRAIMLLDVSKECIKRDGCLTIKVILGPEEP